MKSSLKNRSYTSGFAQIAELIGNRADLQTRLSLMPYDGSAEVKELSDGKYIYIRKRVAGKLTST